MGEETEVYRSRWHKDGNEHYYVLSPITHFLNITEVTFTQPASSKDEDGSSGHSAPSMNTPTSLVVWISLLPSDTTLAAILAKAQTLWYRKPGHIWEALLGRPLTKAELLSQPSWIWAQWPHTCPICHLLILPECPPALSFQWSCWYRESKGKWGRGGRSRTSPTRAIPKLQSLRWTENRHRSVIQIGYPNYLYSSSHHFLLPELDQGRAWSVMPLGMTALLQAAVFHKGENKGCFESLA